MITCIKCGVELEDGISYCPLCGNNPLMPETKIQDSNNPSEIIKVHRKEIRMTLWEMTGIIAFSAIVVCTIVDLLTVKGLGWSLISDIFVLGAWITFTLFIHAYKRTFVIFPGLLLTILIALFIIDLLGPGDKWFLQVGLPITIAVFISTAAITVLYRIANFKGLNIIAAALMILSALCILIELIVDGYLGDARLRWSLIAAVSIFPLALLLLYYHYRLKRGNLLDSFFHV